MSVSAPSVACWARDVVITERAELRLVGYAVVPGAAAPGSVSQRLVLQRRNGGQERALPLAAGPVPDLPAAVRAGVSPRCAGFAAEVPLADERLSLSEGTWDVHVETAVDGGRRRERLAAGHVQRPDQHTSIRAAGDHRFQPYITVAGNLSVEVRGLAGHVEVAEIWVRDDTLTLHGELIGAPPTAPVLARRRGDARVVEWDTGWDGRRVSATLPLARLAAPDAALPEARNWDLVLGGRPALPVGGFCDDVLHKKQVMVFPHCEVAAGGSVRRLRPYYTVHNTVAIISRGVDE